MSVKVESTSVKFGENFIESNYVYNTASAQRMPDGTFVVKPLSKTLKFKTQRKVPKTGMLLVGLGGNNGTTVVGGVLANKLGISWQTRKGEQKPNYFGSLTQSSVVRLGVDAADASKEVFAPMSQMVPMVSPNDLVISGWDCSKLNLGEALQRAAVFEPDLQRQLKPLMEKIVPMPAIFDLEFVAHNQEQRADNVIPGTKAQAVAKVREDIRNFKSSNGLDKVIVLWTANTERFAEVTPELHGTAERLLASLERNEAELAPSTCYAIASILEGCSFINGAPQNTLVPGLVELAKQKGVFLAGDDFKSGQTKMKSALIEFFVGAGIKPECIASYNHLGNNDGRNLASPKQFRSKEITKSNVVDDMVKSNKILFPSEDSKPDHCIVIKYLPYVGDSKRALDEYIFQIFMGGQQCVVMHNTCEDSLLAAPLILDLVILTELMQRVEIGVEGADESNYCHMTTVLSVLSYLLKAPFVPKGTPVVNALNRQRACIENILRAMIGLQPENNMLLEGKVPVPMF